MDLSTGLRECPRGMATGFAQSKQSERENEREGVSYILFTIWPLVSLCQLSSDIRDVTELVTEPGSSLAQALFEGICLCLAAFLPAHAVFQS